MYFNASNDKRRTLDNVSVAQSSICSEYVTEPRFRGSPKDRSPDWNTRHTEVLSYPMVTILHFISCSIYNIGSLTHTCINTYN